MTGLKITTVETLRDFIEWAKSKYTRKLTERIGGCDTCGYGGYDTTRGYETDFDAMFNNIEADIAEFTANLEAEIDEFSATFKKDKS